MSLQNHLFVVELFCVITPWFKSDSSTPFLKSLSKMITPSVQQISKHYPKWFFW